MSFPELASSIHLFAGRNCAAVCSTPPSGVGVGISVSSVLERGVRSSTRLDVGRKYRYICVVKRFGGPTGVIQRVNGIKPSTSGVPPLAFSQSGNDSFEP